MRRGVVALVIGAALAIGCERDDEGSETEVSGAVEDLREARRAVPGEVREIEEDLTEARARVAHLEEQLALARRGVTDDVRREQRELQAELNEQETEISRDVREAQRRASQHNREAELAQRELAQGEQPTEVEGYVESGARVSTDQPTVQTRRTEQQIEVERTEVQPPLRGEGTAQLPRQTGTQEGRVATDDIRREDQLRRLREQLDPDTERPVGAESAESSG